METNQDGRVRPFADFILALGYVLTRPEDVIRDAFNGIVHQVRVEAGREVWLGKVG